METKIECKNCGKDINYKMFSLNTSTKCPYCKTEYAVQKKMSYRIYSYVFILLLLFFLESIVKIDNSIVVIVILAICLMGFEYLNEYIFVGVFKVKRYYQLIEKVVQKDQIKKNKKQKNKKK